MPLFPPPQRHERPPKGRAVRVEAPRWHQWQAVEMGYRCAECFLFRSTAAALPMLGCKGPSNALLRSLGTDTGHHLAEVPLYSVRLAGGKEKHGRAGTMLCCLRCGAYSQYRSRNLAQVCRGRNANGSNALRRIRSGLHPAHGTELRAGTVSVRQAARAAHAVRTRTRPSPAATVPRCTLHETPRWQALRARIAAREQAARAASATGTSA